MARRLDPAERLVIASHNPGKLDEIAALLRPYGVETIGAAALGLAEPEETGSTFEENAELKARAAAGASGLPAPAPSKSWWRRAYINRRFWSRGIWIASGASFETAASRPPQDEVSL